RDHLRRDLQPYMCTYPDCPLPDQLYYDFNSWNMHEQRCHRPIWICNEGHEISFRDRDEYMEHVRVAHAPIAKTLLLPELVDTRESTTRECERDCPFCLRYFSRTMDMQLHISRHLESVALLTLP
ncbi:hypothetical protein DM02DRAFT_505731, partial [Periconia macrospinosa]